MRVILSSYLKVYNTQQYCRPPKRALALLVFLRVFEAHFPVWKRSLTPNAFLGKSGYAKKKNPDDVSVFAEAK